MAHRKASAQKRIPPNHYERVRARTHILYRCFDKKKQLLYVGMTNHPEERLNTHRSMKTWWNDVHHITLQRYPNRRSLEYAELVAIRDEKPKFNITGTRRAAPIPMGGRSLIHLWTDANRFGNIIPANYATRDEPIERYLFPCVQCGARAIDYEPQTDLIACTVCSGEWTYDEWFKLNFPTHATPGVLQSCNSPQMHLW